MEDQLPNRRYFSTNESALLLHIRNKYAWLTAHKRICPITIKELTDFQI